MIARPIQALDLLTPVHRHPPARRIANPTVQQAGLAVSLVAMAPTEERPFAATQQLRRFHLVQLRGIPAAKDVHKPQHTITPRRASVRRIQDLQKRPESRERSRAT
jgi:hypothetical protein